MIKRTKQSGQVALIMVLIMTVVSAVVVSVAGRTTEETKMQRLSKESAEAFLAAQAGLEDAISKQANVSSTIGENKSYSVTLENAGQDGLLTEKINSGASVDIVFSASASLTGVKIYWKPVSGSPSAVLISKYSGNVVTDLAYDTLGANGFTRVNSGGVLSDFAFSYVTPQINVDAGVTRLRVTALGDSSYIGVGPIGDLLPVQKITYNAASSVGTGNDKVKYGLSYEESKNSTTPEVFDYALFSYGSIIQN